MTQNEYKLKWEHAREFIKGHLEEQHFRTWFEPLSFYSYNAQTHDLNINAPSSYFNEYIATHFAQLTYYAIRSQFGNEVNLFFRPLTDSENKIRQTNEVPKNAENIPTRATSQANTSQQAGGNQDTVPRAREIDSHLIAEYSFDNFIEGSSNVFPRSVGISIVQNPKQMTFNPLFIHGHSGVGKTHLVNAIGRAIKEMHPERKVLYLSAHLFHVQYVDSVRKNTVNDFIHFYQQIDVLILDDVQEFIALKSTQNTFFHIFNHLKQNGKQIILTCDRSPGDLQGMEERLLTRFKWGLIAELEQPDERLRRGILTNKIHRNGLQFPREVIDFLSKNVTESVRDLEGVINSLMAHSVVYNCDVNLDMAKRVVKFSSKVENKPITIEEILQQTCEDCHITKEEIISKSRKAPTVQARQIVMFLADKHTNLSTNKIGAIIGKRNHTTVLYSIRQISNQMETDKQLCSKVQEIETNIMTNRKG